MKCPHCGIAFHPDIAITADLVDTHGQYRLTETKCAGCHQIVLFLDTPPNNPYYCGIRFMLYPRVSGRAPLDASVLPEFSKDYAEAAAVLGLSAKASAALSRRCLQNVIRNRLGIKKANLEEEIEAASKVVPSYVSESLQAVRQIGNFAAHPIKSTSSGEIVDVEPGEADWNLDTLDLLFDFCFVQPAVTAAKKEALNKKLTSAGKPTIL